MSIDFPDRLMTVREAAASIRVSEETIRRWMRSGVIPYKPVGAFKMIRKADLLAKDAADCMPTAVPRHLDTDREQEQEQEQEIPSGRNPVQPQPAVVPSTAVQSAIGSLQAGSHPSGSRGARQGTGNKGRR